MTRLTPLLQAFTLTLLTFLTLTHANDDPKTRRVKRGESIQKAIDLASPGEKIIVEAGTYAEILTIAKDGIELEGRRATLTQPEPGKIGTPNLCNGLAGPGTITGICVHGKNIGFGTFAGETVPVTSVGTYVKNVIVRGFDVVGFTGINIAVVGGENVKVLRNGLIDGGRYGGLTSGSKKSRFSDNNVVSKASGLPFIGLCMANDASPEVSYNDISDYQTALCVQSNGADVKGNRVKNTCVGAFVDPNIDGAFVGHNTIKDSNSKCSSDPVSFGVYGVFVLGGKNTQVVHNTIQNLKDDGVDEQGAPRTAVGIAVFDFTFVNPPIPAVGNVVRRNSAKGSEVDIIIGSAANQGDHNQCDIVIPAGFGICEGK